MSSDAAAAERPTGLGLGPPDQVSFAVADIAEAVSVLGPLLGEFTVRESVQPPTPADTATPRPS